ncbi:MAG: hypothetical protein AAB779_02490 [Patescibacteria group bacterium]
MQQKQVVIVQEGTFEAKHYDSYTETLCRVLRGYKKSPDPGKNDVEPQQVATVEVVVSDDLAEEKVKAGQADIIIFVSAGMYYAAKRFRAKYPRLAVYVLAGRAVDEEPFIIPKLVLYNKEALELLLEV